MTSALLMMLSLAHADVLTLDNGALLEGHLDHFEHDGECVIGVDGGPLAGTLVVVSCARVVRFERGVDEPVGAAVAVVGMPPVAEPQNTVTEATAATEPVGVAAVVAAPVAAPVAEPAVAAAPAVAQAPVAEVPEASAVAEAPVEEAPAPAVADAAPEAVAAKDAEPEAPAEPPARTGWRAALPEGFKLPELGRSR